MYIYVLESQEPDDIRIMYIILQYNIQLLLNIIVSVMQYDCDDAYVLLQSCS